MKEKDSDTIYSVPTDGTIIYPESDGKPMAETDMHRDLMVDMIWTLRNRYQDHPDVYVSGDLLMYYEEGNPRKSVAPDVFVVFGVEKKQRRTYLMWDEGKGPDFVLELASKNTYQRDLTAKKDLYAHVLRVKEYYIHDPEGLYLRPSLRGFRLVDGVYEEIHPVNNRFACETLGLELGEQVNGLKLYDPETQSWVMTPEEKAEARASQELQARQQAEAKVQQAEARAQRELQARQEAEAELARLQEELEQLRAMRENP